MENGRANSQPAIISSDVTACLVTSGDIFPGGDWSPIGPWLTDAAASPREERGDYAAPEIIVAIALRSSLESRMTVMVSFRVAVAD